jgi:SAM-dependent methyltransferase
MQTRSSFIEHRGVTLPSAARPQPGIGVARDLLICPVCRKSLDGVFACRSCGEDFASDTGTPVLMSGQSSAEIRYVFRSRDSVVGEDFYQALRYPPRPAVQGPYHLDPAHALILQNLHKGSRVLEIGCGGGQMREWVSARGLTYIGTDISKTRVLEHLRVHGGPDYLCDAHFLPFRDEAFDAVYTSAVTEHIADLHLMMSEVMRVLKPGGVYMGNGSFLEPWNDDSYYHQSPLGAFRSLRRVGFDVPYVWPGVGYTAFTAMFLMGNRLTKMLQPLGTGVAWLHRFALTLRRWMKHPDPPGGEIAWDAAVAGAIDWIAVKPSNSSGPHSASH